MPNRIASIPPSRPGRTRPAGQAVLLLLGALAANPSQAAFVLQFAYGSSAAFSSNIDGQSQFDDHRFQPDLTSSNKALVASSISVASGDYNFPDQWHTACVRNDGVTPCNGTEGPGESGRIYTTPETYIARSGGRAVGTVDMLGDNGLLRVKALASSGAALQVSAVTPTAPDRLYERPVDVREATANASAELHTTQIVHGIPGVGRAVFSGHIDGSVYGNGVVSDFDPVDPLNTFDPGRAGADFTFSATSWRPGYACGTFGCPGKNFFARFGDAVGATDNSNNASIPFTMEVDIIDGFLLQTWMRLNAHANGNSGALFGSTARIDSIELSDGFSFDLSDGLMQRSGNVYTYVLTDPASDPGGDPGTGNLPEPAGLALTAAALGALGWHRRTPRRRR